LCPSDAHLASDHLIDIAKSVPSRFAPPEDCLGLDDHLCSLCFAPSTVRPSK
jgi:hypothetical protein